LPISKKILNASPSWLNRFSKLTTSKLSPYNKKPKITPRKGYTTILNPKYKGQNPKYFVR
jgi:hypothetical protein